MQTVDLHQGAQHAAMLGYLAQSSREAVMSSLSATHPPSAAQTLPAHIKQFVSSLRFASRLRSGLQYELDCLDRVGELDGILANIGLARGAVPLLLKRFPDAVRRHAAMTDRLGIEAPSAPALFDMNSFSKTLRRCVFCSKTRQCDQWLRRGGGRDGYRTFCPNAQLFEGMRSSS